MENQDGKIKSFLGKVLEPLALVLLLILIVLPVLTVLNLTPITREFKLNVLGAKTNTTGYSIKLIQGKHEIFTSEKLEELGSNTFEYITNIGKRGKDTYSKPILKIKNESKNTKTFVLEGHTGVNTKSNISIIIEEKSYLLQDSEGQVRKQEIVLSPSDEKILFLFVQNENNVQFSEELRLNITEK